MKLFPILSSVAILGASLVSCNDTSTIGSSVIQDSIEIYVDSTFTVTGQTVENNDVQSRTITQLIGILDSKEFGYIKSDVVTQFMPSNSLVTSGVSVDDIDSLKLLMAVPTGAFVGDSVVPMGLNVYRLNKQLPSPIYSSFNPEGYYSKGDKLASKIYNVTALSDSSQLDLDGYRQIAVDLPVSLGRELFQKFLDSPETYQTPTAFAEFFPGIYIENSYGSGRLMRVSQMVMSMYYRQHTTSDSTGNDTIISQTGNYFAVTPEIVTNNNIQLNISDNIKQMVAAGDNIILAPAGLDVEIKFPGREIVEKYKTNKGSASVINTLSFVLPASTIDNSYGIETPPALLMVLKSKKESFFANNDLTDNVTSFTAEYDEDEGTYTFSGMRDYILDLMTKDTITDDDVTFTLTPVYIVTESSSSSSSSSSYYYYYYYYYYGSSSSTTTYTTSILPYISAPVMTKLDLDKAKIYFTFSKQSVSF